MKFLIVDDSKAMQTIVHRAMLQLGYADQEYEYAFDGAEALGKIQVSLPDLVLCDWHMPNMDGLELLKKINEMNPAPPFGFITTERSKEQIQKAKDNGALFIVAKPFSAEKLGEAVTEALAEAKRRLVFSEVSAKSIAPDLSSELHTGNVRLNEINSSEINVNETRINIPNKFDIAQTFSAFSPYRTLCIPTRELVAAESFPLFIAVIRAASAEQTCVFLIFDLPLATMLGAIHMNKNKEQLQEQIQEKRVDDDCTQICELITKNMARFIRQNGSIFRTSSFHTAREPSDKIIKLIQDKKNHGVFSYQIDIEGFGEGRFHVIVK